MTKPPAEARVALHLLAGLFPPAQRGRLRSNVLDEMENAFRAGGREVPDWVAGLRKD